MCLVLVLVVVLLVHTRRNRKRGMEVGVIGGGYVHVSCLRGDGGYER